MESLARNILVGYFVLFISFALLARSYWVYKKTGINALTQSHQDSTLKKLSWIFKLQLLMAFAQVIDYGLAIDWLTQSRFEFLYGDISATIGSLILLSAFFILVSAQQQMDVSWRIEVDSDSPVGLVERGWFRFSRNPIFLSLRASYFAMFLIVPCPWSLVTFLLSEIAFQWQVKKEEFYLQQKYGAAYSSYCARVRRWI